MGYAFDVFDVIREKSSLICPLWDFCCFMGVRLDLPTSSCIVCVEGVMVLVLHCFPFDESGGMCEDLLPIIVSPRTYFQKTCLVCCLFVVLNL